MIVKPFAAVRPLDELAADASSLPAGSNERESLMGTLSALDINDSDLPDSSEPTAVYEAGRRMLDELIAKGTFIVDDSPCFYLYELEQNGHSQVGVVGCCSIDDYADCTIKKHENTIAQKAASVVRRLDTLNMQTGPIYLAYRDEEDVDAIVDEALKNDPLYSFVSKEGVTNTVWRISDPAVVEALQQAFTKVPTPTSPTATIAPPPPSTWASCAAKRTAPSSARPRPITSCRCSSRPTSCPSSPSAASCAI